MKKRRAGERPQADTEARSGARAPSLALGYLALLPLIAAHECGAALDPGGLVNLGAALLVLPLAPLGARALEISWVIYALLGAVSLVLLFRAEYALLPRLLRVLGEGALAALALGPLLLGLCWLLGQAGAGSALRASPPEHTPALARVGVLCGGAAFEEIVFRLGCLSIVFLLARRGLSALGVAAGASGRAAEGLALALSALVFAGAHLALVVEPLLGAGGEPFEAAVFTWRVLAGILLGILFRWRGMGVAAWAHALFNLALTIGAGPEILL